MDRFGIKSTPLLLIICFILGSVVSRIWVRTWLLNFTFFLLGSVATLIRPASLPGFIRSALFGDSTSDEVLYGLDHDRLNLDLPCKSLWMNMGYWQHADDFKTACRDLLFQVILQAKVFDAWGTLTRESGRFVSLVDLGFGCGDQTLAMMRVPRKDGSGPNAKVTGYASMFDNYVGVTLHRGQFAYAKARFKDAELEGRENFRVFCADAARPDSWNEDLKEAMSTLQAESKFRPDPDTNATLKNEIWILALDCLYHFKPSRFPILKYAAKELKANIMAFDLMLDDDISIWDHILLNIVRWLMGCPQDAFMNLPEYRSEFHVAGYRLDHVEVFDMSEHVFAPLAKFLRRREQELKAIGAGLGKLKAAMWLFEWWASRPVIKGAIVVAKHHERSFDPP